LADIDAPELGTPEGEVARDALSYLISTYGTRVYLDVDDIYVMDRYNRIVAVAYLRYNSTHVLNVNERLVENGYAVIKDYYNEFDPYSWKLFEYLPYDPCYIKTVTITKITTITTTTTSISTSVSPSQTTYTTTVTTASNASAVGGVGFIMLIIGFIIGYLLRRRRR